MHARPHVGKDIDAQSIGGGRQRTAGFQPQVHVGVGHGVSGVVVHHALNRSRNPGTDVRRDRLARPEHRKSIPFPGIQGRVHHRNHPHRYRQRPVTSADHRDRRGQPPAPAFLVRSFPAAAGAERNVRPGISRHLALKSSPPGGKMEIVGAGRVAEIRAIIVHRVFQRPFRAFHFHRRAQGTGKDELAGLRRIVLFAGNLVEQKRAVHPGVDDPLPRRPGPVRVLGSIQPHRRLPRRRAVGTKDRPFNGPEGRFPHHPQRLHHLGPVAARVRRGKGHGATGQVGRRGEIGLELVPGLNKIGQGRVGTARVPVRSDRLAFRIGGRHRQRHRFRRVHLPVAVGIGHRKGKDVRGVVDPAQRQHAVAPAQKFAGVHVLLPQAAPLNVRGVENRGRPLVRGKTERAVAVVPQIIAGSVVEHRVHPHLGTPHHREGGNGRRRAGRGIVSVAGAGPRGGSAGVADAFREPVQIGHRPAVQLPDEGKLEAGMGFHRPVIVPPSEVRSLPAHPTAAVGPRLHRSGPLFPPQPGGGIVPPQRNGLAGGNRQRSGNFHADRRLAGQRFDGRSVLVPQIEFHQAVAFQNFESVGVALAHRQKIAAGKGVDVPGGGIDVADGAPNLRDPGRKGTGRNRQFTHLFPVLLDVHPVGHVVVAVQHTGHRNQRHVQQVRLPPRFVGRLGVAGGVAVRRHRHRKNRSAGRRAVGVDALVQGKGNLVIAAAVGEGLRGSNPDPGARHGKTLGRDLPAQRRRQFTEGRRRGPVGVQGRRSGIVGPGRVAGPADESPAFRRLGRERDHRPRIVFGLVGGGGHLPLSFGPQGQGVLNRPEGGGHGPIPVHGHRSRGKGAGEIAAPSGEFPSSRRGCGQRDFAAPGKDAAVGRNPAFAHHRHGERILNRVRVRVRIWRRRRGRKPKPGVHRFRFIHHNGFLEPKTGQIAAPSVEEPAGVRDGDERHFRAIDIGSLRRRTGHGTPAENAHGQRKGLRLGNLLEAGHHRPIRIHRQGNRRFRPFQVAGPAHESPAVRRPGGERHDGPVFIDAVLPGRFGLDAPLPFHRRHKREPGRRWFQRHEAGGRRPLPVHEKGVRLPGTRQIAGPAGESPVFRGDRGERHFGPGFVHPARRVQNHLPSAVHVHGQRKGIRGNGLKGGGHRKVPSHHHDPGRLVAGQIAVPSGEGPVLGGNGGELNLAPLRIGRRIRRPNHAPLPFQNHGQGVTGGVQPQGFPKMGPGRNGRPQTERGAGEDIGCIQPGQQRLNLGVPAEIIGGKVKIERAFREKVRQGFVDSNPVGRIAVRVQGQQQPRHIGHGGMRRPGGAVHQIQRAEPRPGRRLPQRRSAEEKLDGLPVFVKKGSGFIGHSGSGGRFVIQPRHRSVHEHPLPNRRIVPGTGTTDQQKERKRPKGHP